DRLGMPDMQIAVRFRRKSRDHAAAVLAGPEVLGDDLTKEVGAGYAAQFLRRCSIHCVLFMNKSSQPSILTLALRPVIGPYARALDGPALEAACSKAFGPFIVDAGKPLST